MVPNFFVDCQRSLLPHYPFLHSFKIPTRESCSKREKEGGGGSKLAQFQTIARSQNAVAPNLWATNPFVRLCSYIEKHAVVSLLYPRIKSTWSSAHLPEHLGLNSTAQLPPQHSAVINVARLIEQRPLYVRSMLTALKRSVAAEAFECH